MNKTSHPYLVPNGDSRQETAVLLVGTADEFGIDQREVRAVREGFRISQSMADALGLGADPEAEPEAEPETVPDEPVLTGQVPVSGNDPDPEPKPTTRKKSTTSKTNASGNRAGENEE